MHCSTDLRISTKKLFTKKKWEKWSPKKAYLFYPEVGRHDLVFEILQREKRRRNTLVDYVSACVTLFLWLSLESNITIQDIYYIWLPSLTFAKWSSSSKGRKTNAWKGGTTFITREYSHHHTICTSVSNTRYVYVNARAQDHFLSLRREDHREKVFSAKAKPGRHKCQIPGR